MDLIFNQPIAASHSQNLHKVSSVKAEYLSQKEMDETEGEWLNVALGAGFGVLGGMGGGISYLATTSNPTWSGGLSAVGWGSVAGATAGFTGGAGWGLFATGSTIGSFYTPTWGW